LKIKALLKLVFFVVFELNKIKKAKVIFFFPYYHTGGAEKVHLNIVKAVSDVDNYIFFTDISYSDNYKAQFYSYANGYEIYDFLNRNYALKKIFTMVLKHRINTSKKLISLFGCHSGFYYEILPLLSTKIKKYDLIHAFIKPDKGGVEISSLPYAKMLNNRVVIDNKVKLDLIELYKLKGLSELEGKIQLIPNGLEMINIGTSNKSPSFFYVGFVGRWAKEKRPELYLKIANKIKQLHYNITFVIAGPNFEDHRQAIHNSGIIDLGEIKNENVLNEWYNKLDVILVTSYREGFPMVIMEAMMHGVIPISTNVGSISEHIIDDYNGFLIENTLSESEIINKFVEKIIYLYQNKEKRTIISHDSINYATNKFGIHNFEKKYRSLLLG
jgi:glycosyltransferase involved in cell wall biosynthesis